MGSIVQRGEAGRPRRYAQRREPPGDACRLPLPHGGRDLFLEVIGILDPLELVALGLGAAEHERAARMWSEVRAEIGVDDDRPARLDREVGGARHHVDLLAQRPRPDADAVERGEPVDVR